MAEICSDFEMATVVKDSRNRSPYWICCYTDATGRRLKKSTKHTNKKKAFEFCLALEHGEELARNGALSEARLRKLLEETFERTSGVPIDNYSAATWFDEWCAQKSESRAEATAERYRQVMRDFLRSLGPRADLPLEHITARDIRAYRNAELAAGKSNRTANLSVKIISTAFNRALRLGKIKLNPCHALDHLPEETAERSTFTSQQIRNLIKAAHGDWKIAILIGFYTGARLSDIANLRWNAINFEDRLVSFVPRKTKRAKKILLLPLHPNLEAALLKERGLPLAFVLPKLAGRSTGGAHGLSAEFGAIMERSEIRPRIIRHTDRGRANKTLSFHSLRHSFNSALANAGVARELRQALTGHATEKMNEIYTHREVEPLRAAIAALPQL
jgi:integrase